MKVGVAVGARADVRLQAREVNARTDTARMRRRDLKNMRKPPDGGGFAAGDIIHEVWVDAGRLRGKTRNISSTQRLLILLAS
jgi:hypothetical protein